MNTGKSTIGMGLVRGEQQEVLIHLYNGTIAWDDNDGNDSEIFYWDGGSLDPFPLNQPPVADAGLDQTVECSNPVSTEVTLDGSGSNDPDDDPLTYTWTGPFPEGGGTVPGVNPTVTLPLGDHTITLVVNDREDDSEPDEVSVAITVGVVGLLPPLAGLVPEGDPLLSPDKALKCGRTIPLKLQLFCGDSLLSDADVSPPEIIGLVRTGDAFNLETVDLDAGEANDSGWLFRFADDQWIYCLCTKNLTPGSYELTIEMPDHLAYSSGFTLRQLQFPAFTIKTLGAM